MAEPVTIARPYAEALFKAMAADLTGAAVWVDELAAIAGNPQLLQFANDPNVSSQQVLDLFLGVARTALPEHAKNFLRTVIDNGRLNVMPEIAAHFRALSNSRSGSSDAVIYSAFAMSAQAVTEVSAVLEKRFARKLNVTVEIDESLIGGIRAVVGDEVLDTSVKARLEQMKVALTA
jgi:F-type H+-transporting ATPase subunit delta